MKRTDTNEFSTIVHESINETHIGSQTDIRSQSTQSVI